MTFKPRCDNSNCVNYGEEFGHGCCYYSEEYEAGCDEQYTDDDIDEEEEEETEE